MGQQYCMQCMRPMEQGDTACKACGYTPCTDSPVHHLKCGTVLKDKYLIGMALGEGGFGITYLGRDLTLDMRIAIKEYYPNGCANRNHEHSNAVTVTQGGNGIDFEKDMQRFLSEARILARFSNEPGVVCVRDYFRENGTAYIVMEYLDGVTLKDCIGKFGPIAPETLFPMIDPILKVLGDIHQQGLIHRDISPDNIMLLKDGRLKLLDFGAAREVTGEKSLSVVLKPGYAPEEQYRSKGQQGPWTDVYAMCATIYKCITGVTPDESIQRVFEDELKPPSELGVAILPNQEMALMQGLSVKSADRMPNMFALRIALLPDDEEDIKSICIRRMDTEQMPRPEKKTEYQPRGKETVYDAAAKEVTVEQKPEKVTVEQTPRNGPAQEKKIPEKRDDTRKSKAVPPEKKKRKRAAPGKRKPWVIVLGVAVVAVVAAVILLISPSGNPPEAPEMTVYRYDIQDYVKVQLDASAKVTDFAVTGSTVTEEGTLVVSCTVSYSGAAGGKQGEFILTYTQNKDTWVLNQCRVAREEGNTAPLAEIAAPSVYGYALAKVGSIDDPQRELTVKFGALLRNRDDGWMMLNYLGQETGCLASTLEYIGSGVYTVQSPKEDVNCIGLISREGEMLIPAEACHIAWPKTAYAHTDRYLVVTYITGETTDPDTCFIDTYKGFSAYGTLETYHRYTGYARVYDLKNKNFVDNVTVTNSDSFAVQPCGDHFFVTDTAGTSVLYNEKGESLFQTARRIEVGNGTFIVNDGGTYRVYDQDANQTYTSNKGLYLMKSDGGYLTKYEDGRDTILDRYGNPVCGMTVDTANEEIGGAFRIKNGGKAGLLGLDGTVILPCNKYDNLEHVGANIYRAYRPEGDGYLYTLIGPEGIIAEDLAVSGTGSLVLTEGRKAFVVNDGAFSLTLEDDYPQKLMLGMIAAQSDADGLYGVFDLFTGQQLLDYEYEVIKVAAGYLYAYKGGAWTVYRVEGPEK